MPTLTELINNPEAKAKLLAHHTRIAALINQGVIIPAPHSVEIGEGIVTSQIAPGVVLHPGVRLHGPLTLLAPGVEIGREGPCLIDNVVAGHGVQIDGGSFTDVTFLDGAEARSWSHMRRGTLLEEKARVAHCVGLKQTILFPYVTLGSLINFCDVLMAGGTGPKDHSEVGSGYIHFNFTPRGDKATPSIYGDVCQGVFLKQSRIFLGGLGATVGPMKVGYGAFLGPGEVFRRDVKQDAFILGEKRRTFQIDFDPAMLTGVKGKILRNVRFVAQLSALWSWYDQVRSQLSFGDAWRSQVLEGGKRSVTWAIQERLKQLESLIGLLPMSIERLREKGAERPALEQECLIKQWPNLRSELEKSHQLDIETQQRDALLKAIVASKANTYIEVIQGIDDAAQEAGQNWLTAITEDVYKRAVATLSND